MQDEHATPAVSDEVLTAYLERQLRSGRVKLGVLMVQFEKAFPGVERDRLVTLESGHLKR